ncbi:hypothetical protein [Streptomyces sp. WM4235]|nr:hypothetical protein [Streptomyces sp. WM4235]
MFAIAMLGMITVGWIFLILAGGVQGRIGTTSSDNWPILIPVR